ncbi:MAG: TonB-dependent receptor [Gemmataceae bacterium]|nr:TonB-dependent receptor [Gemmataceae bacterium]
MKGNLVRKYCRLAILPGLFAAVAWPLTILGQPADDAAGEDPTGQVLQAQAGQPPQKQPDLVPPELEEPTLVVPTVGGAGKPLPGAIAGGSGAKSEITVDKASPSASVDQALRDAPSATGVGSQRRSAVSFDPRVRGYHIGQLVSYANGGFWAPARIDLDTALGKINPDWVQEINVIKGPYSVRYGPGFAFIDVVSLPPERYKNGEFEAYGSTALTYRTNGNGWTGRQYVWGGHCDWGFRLGYNLLAGNDYEMGNGDRLPSSYNSHDADFAVGFDLSDHSALEVKYLRVQQYDVEYPGLLTDINNQATDGMSVRYTAKDGRWFDRLTVDGWYNMTSFNGDSSRPGKRFQIPELNAILDPTVGDNPRFLRAANQVRLDLDTEADLYTWGLREAMTWGEDKCVQLTIGADISFIRQQYNEFDSFNLSPPVNNGIPKTRMIDPGIFIDGALPWGETIMFRAGTRVDFVSTELIQLGPGMNPNEYLVDQALAAEAFNTQEYFLWSAFATVECKPNDVVTYTAGYGYSQRPPSLTELYTNGAFFGLIQDGFNAIYGNPTLDQETIHQFDVGMSLGNRHTRLRGGAHAFCAWVPDYITYQRLLVNGLERVSIENVPVDVDGDGRIDPQTEVLDLQTRLRQLRFVNTSMARLLGGEVYAEYDLLPWLAPFGTLSYVDGRDLGRHEALPGIVPLEGRVGLRFHDPNKDNPRWGVEFMSRIVNVQNQAAESLGERVTPGFTVFDLRGFWQPREKLLLTAGVENMLDRFYQEHLDLRTGRGVFQPGVNFYVGMRVSY